MITTNVYLKKTQQSKTKPCKYIRSNDSSRGFPSATCAKRTCTDAKLLLLVKTTMHSHMYTRIILALSCYSCSCSFFRVHACNYMETSPPIDSYDAPMTFTSSVLSTVRRPSRSIFQSSSESDDCSSVVAREDLLPIIDLSARFAISARTNIQVHGPYNKKKSIREQLS